MYPYERVSTGLATSATELRQLIIDNPGLPLLVFAGEDANCGGDYNYTSCSRVRASIGEFLDCAQTVNDCRVFEDRDDFEEELKDCYSDFNGSDAEFDQFIENILREYEPYWKRCIILYVDN
jgi:hypothetical protein